MQTNTIGYRTNFEIAAEQQRFMTKVFGWMTVALAVTGFIALYIATTPAIVEFIFARKALFFGIIIAELLLVGSLAALVNRISANQAMGLFISYAALNGVTFSAIFLLYTAESIASTFFVTAGTFGAMALFGYTTKRDLTKMGSLLYMALIGVIIASVVNMFMNSSMIYWITTYLGVIIFVGLTAYDVQKIKRLNIIGNEGTDEDKKEAIIGALTLYLDFINLFLYLLRIFGNRK